MFSSSMTFRTESLFWRAEGEVLDRGDYRLVRTPSNPGYYGGNLLAFDRPPAVGDYERWLGLFEREFGDLSGVRHRLFVWDTTGGVDGAVEPFLDAGFDLKTNVTLLARAVVPPPKVNKEIEVRRVETDEEWESVLAFKVRVRDPRFEEDSYTHFKRRWLGVRRGLAEAGHGSWYGAFVGGRMVADLGIFRDGPVARFQDVATEPSFRRRGICGTLVHEVAKRTLGEGVVETLVMVADEGYHAARIYESVGFRLAERHAKACLYPPRQ